MNVGLRKPMTLTEFLALEERQELRFEFNGCEPVDMTGGTIVHDRITFNIASIRQRDLSSATSSANRRASVQPSSRAEAMTGLPPR
jgi:hypothetical protein